jgi:hypothetical protein
MREIKKYLKNKKGVKYKPNTNIGIGTIGFNNGNDIIRFPLLNYSVITTPTMLVYNRYIHQLVIDSNDRSLDNFLLNKRSGEKYSIYIHGVILEGCFVKEYNYHGYDDNNIATFRFSVDTCIVNL